MKSYFSGFLEIELAASERQVRIEIAKDIGAAAAKGTSRSGRRWLVLEDILCTSMSSFGEKVRTKLGSLDPEHSPLTAADYNAADLAIRAYRKRCDAIHAELRSKENSTYPKSRAPFEGGDMDRAESMALNEIKGQLAAYESKRSFRKWALGDLRKRVWSGMLVSIGAVAAELIRRLLQLAGS